jgi:hypothetical protein
MIAALRSLMLLVAGLWKKYLYCLFYIFIVSALKFLVSLSNFIFFKLIKIFLKVELKNIIQLTEKVFLKQT